MPHLPVKTVVLDLVHHHPVGVAENLEPLGRHLAQAANRKTRTWEGLAVNHLLGHAQLQPDRTHLVLEQVAQRLDELKAQAGREATHVVVRLDLDGGRRHVRRRRLDHVGVERALGEEVDPAQAQRFGLEHSDELAPDDSPLLFRVDHAAERLQEPVGRIDVADVHVEVSVHDREHALRLFLAQQAVVDEHARQLVADGAMNEGRGHRRIHASRQSADHSTVTDLRTDALCGLGDERACSPRRIAVADAVEEVAQHLATAGRVNDLRMKLDAEDALAVREGGHRRVAARGQGVESGRQLADMVAVTHPDGELGIQAVEKSVRLPHREQRGAVLARMTRIDFAAEVVGDQLHAVADAEHRNPRAEGLGVDLRSTGLVHAGGPAAQDQAGRVALLQLGPGRGAGDQLAVDVRLAHAARDQLAELRSEVENKNRLLILQGGDTPPVNVRAKPGHRRPPRAALF